MTFRHDQKFQNIINTYFQEPKRQMNVKAGVHVLEQGGYNDRLFWVRSGLLIAYFHDEDKDLTIEFFKASTGMFFGLHSFFSRNETSSTTVIAQTDCELAWIDLTMQAIEPEKNGSLAQQFMPIIVHELANRQMEAGIQAMERTKAVEQLAASEHMTTLGALAAGLAHELNNAVGVISNKNESIQNAFIELLMQCRPELSQFFNLGISKGQTIGSSDVRSRAKVLEYEYRLYAHDAKLLARAIPQGDIPDAWLTNLAEAIKYWDIGRDLYDMKLATKHATSIVRSVKQLGGSNHERHSGVDLNDTINKALALLQGNLRPINVILRPAVLPTMTASVTELVQVWINIIKNACDAMCSVDEPKLEITTRFISASEKVKSSNEIDYLVVIISNNGPMILEETRRKIFLPSFTTKKGGLSFGLGLGLSIVQRIVHSYQGGIIVKSDEHQTTFRVKIPLISN